MHYVILRDDDTNAFTPIECLERLYRPFLDRGLPVNLALIPAVNATATTADGKPEGFLCKAPGQSAAPEPPSESPLATARTIPFPQPLARNSPFPECVPIGSNQGLVSYLRANPGFNVVQHGCHHDFLEFDCPSSTEVASKLDRGAKLLLDAGFPRPRTFVAPYDRLSRVALAQIPLRFEVLSTGWYEWRRLPYGWLPRYAIKKMRHSPHWQVGRTLLLSHPGCLLSCYRTYSTMLGGILHYLQTQQLTVLVTHWWEYFRNDEPDNPFIDFLHETASYLATHPNLKVITFGDLLKNQIPLN